MSVLSSNEIKRSCTEDDKGLRIYTRVFRVETDSNGDGPEIILANATSASPDPIPDRRAFYLAGGEANPYALCRTRDVDIEEKKTAGCSWLVVCKYDENVRPNTDGDNDNPLARPPEVYWSFAQFQRPAEKDTNGNAIKTSAGEAFVPPPERDDSRLILRYVRNQAAFDVALAVEYQDAVNSDEFLGVAAKKVKVASITAQDVWERNLLYWKVTYEFHFRNEGFQSKPLNKGFQYKLEADGEIVKVPKGQPGVLLAADGTILPEGDTATFGGTEGGYDIYTPLPFSVFNIII